jgi:hypothetical protein
MFFEGVLTPGRRAASATPEPRARTSERIKNRLVNLGPFSTVVVMASYEILVWSDYI